MENAKGCVLAIHGYSSFAEWEFMTYPGQEYSGSFVQAFNNLGFNVYAFDLQGFGRSEAYGGLRGERLLRLLQYDFGSFEPTDWLGLFSFGS